MNEDDLMKQFEAFYKDKHPEEINPDITSKKFVNNSLKGYMNKVSEYVSSHVVKDLVNPEDAMNAIEAIMALAAVKRIVTIITDHIDEELEGGKND